MVARGCDNALVAGARGVANGTDPVDADLVDAESPHLGAGLLGAAAAAHIDDADRHPYAAAYGFDDVGARRRVGAPSSRERVVLGVLGEVRVQGGLSPDELHDRPPRHTKTRPTRRHPP
ncbi:MULTISPECIES: hypothetical protein [unclassified Streptomyces]|uniref:hypothetical protein n=1 Tax=unclassified Streptomyces TaxID=2593676 RepID=UPI002B1CCC96|nr:MULTISPECIES: hypothetical protein [unclassified Streptomyces]